MPRVIFVNRFYWPEEPATSQLLTDLAQSVADAGFMVCVITSCKAQSPCLETHRGVDILRVGPVRHDGRALVFRVFDFVSFISAALWRLLRLVRGGDTVVIMTDPPMLGALSAPLLEWRDVRLIHWIQDIYPDVAISVTGQRWMKFLKPWRDYAWRQAECCVTLGKDMASVLKGAAVADERITIIPNWAPEGLTEAPTSESNAIKTAWGVAEKFVILYSGNLGHVHDLMPVLDIAENLRNEPDIAFVFVGSGAQQNALRESAQNRRLHNIVFQPHQPRSRLGAALSAGDLHCVTLKEGCERCVLPSKLHGIIAVARPILFIGPKTSELFSMITEQKLGVSFTRNQAAVAAAEIRALKSDSQRRIAMSAAARQLHQETGFSASRLAWLNLLGRPSLKPSH